MAEKRIIHNNYDMILEKMVDGLFTVDENRVITYMNKAAEVILGYKKEEVTGKTCDFLKSPTCMGAILANKDGKCPLFSEKEIVRKRCVITAKDGSTKYLIKNAQVVREDDGRIIGGIENIVDITHQIEKDREINLLQQELKGRRSFCKIIGNHYSMQNIYALLDLAKDSNSSVLIYGESGTGKELVAQAIHTSSFRKDKPFIKVNCAALAETLLESELFGHVKGAYTDAIRDRKGRFEEADGGTIFLDEIGDLPPSVQVKLLRVLQEKEIERVGDNTRIRVDVHIIAATHKDLPKLILEGKFREDFFYRLNVIPISIPPLRERMTDIPLLVEHFIAKFCRETGKHIITCDEDTLDILMQYNWPGNVRELENAIEYAFVTCRTDTIRLFNLPEQVRNGSQPQPVSIIQESVLQDDKQQIVNALEVTRGNKTKAAQMLGYSRVTLWKKMKKFGISNGFC